MRMPPTGILQTEMDEETLLEIELRQDLERLDLEDDNFADLDNYDDDLEINNNGPPLPLVGEDGVLGVEDEGVPAELQDYINAIQKQRQRFEEELEECDTLIDRAVNTARGEDDREKPAVFDDEGWKELEEEAAHHGMTVEDYRKKLLQDIEDEPFKMEEMDFLTTDDTDFILPQSPFDEALEADSSGMALMVAHPLHVEEEEVEPSAEDMMIEKALNIARTMEAEQRRQSQAQGESGQLVPVGNIDTEQDTERDAHQAPVLAVAALSGDADSGQNGSDDCQGPVEAEQDSASPPSASEANPLNDQTGEGTVAVFHSHPLHDFEQYLREQFQLADERFRYREQQLKQELECRREVEERLMLTMEENKLSAQHTLQQEQQRLALQKEESQKKLDQAIERQQEVLEKELKEHEKAIATLTAQLEEDRHQLEKVQRAEDERLAQRNNKAATTVQRHYRGHRARMQHQGERQRLAERREQRREERQQQRIQEIEQQIQQRKDEEERKAQEVKRAKEEEERKIEEEKRKREEEERLKKEEEERLKKEEEEERKRKREEEERLKREEEEERKRKAEEEKRRKEEEARQLKEEQKRKKQEEEERKKREKEDRKKREEEEEKKQKEDEVKRRKEEEERKEKKAEEERRKQEEEQKRLEEERKHKEEEEKQRMDEEARKKERKENEDEKADHGKTETKSEPDSHPLDNSSKSPAAKVESSVTKEGRQPQDCEKGHSVSPLVFDLEPVNANILPNSLEERRLAWMKGCLPWSKISNEPWKLKSGSGEKVTRRPASAKKLSPLPENIILESAQVASLRQVTTVQLKDLPGHALSPLGACSQLKHLSLMHCGLKALDGLSNCKHLQCVNVQDNLIEYVDLKELSSLYTVNLSHNKLSSIHGLEGCTNLRWLDVSHNRLTKLGGLSPLRRLHTLQVSHNQLVSCQGLEVCPSLQQLDLSANYLTAVQGLNRLGLLLSLNLASNNLTQMPSLENNVLLQDLVLRENSVGPDLDLSAPWLPLLTSLDLSQNIIEQLTGSAGGMFVLKRLDLAVNQITDMSSFLPALSDCPRLEDLSLQGNAVLDEENFRENLKNSLPCLLCVNGETLRSQVSCVRPTRCFEIMCLDQLHSHRDLKNAFDKERGSVPDEGNSDNKQHSCDSCFKFCDRSFKMTVEHRYAHEYGELTSANVPAPPQTPKSHRPASSARTPRVAGARAAASGPPTHSAAVNDGGKTAERKEEVSPGSNGSSSAVMLEKNGAWAGEENGALLSDGQGESASSSSSSPVLSQKEKFDLALKAGGADTAAVRASSDRGQAVPSDGRDGGSAALSQLPAEGRGWGLGEESGARPGKSGTTGARAAGGRDAAARHSGVEGKAEQQQQQQPQLSAKEKFERALAGLPPTSSSSSTLPPVATHPLPPSLPHTKGAVSGTGEKTTEDYHRSSPSKKTGGVTADMVGGLMMAESAAMSRSPLTNKLLEGDLDDLDDLEEMMEGLHFDIDGFLDLDQFDFDENFLEKGWRPEDSPQFPQSHPVLGRIPPSSSSAAKPPLPPLIHNSSSLPHPSPPHGRPTQAWQNDDDDDGGWETPPIDLQARAVPPLLRPPSSVGSGEDSQAITTGRTKREEKLAEEWGFKDSRTAELMVQRANKMKYNAERRRKLSKLDPQQRLRLFRKLEEVKGVRAVRPPPPRVLPRKEYFQAREDEAMQRDMERQMEHKTRAGRTFEWLHTQVGEHDISSSRINPGGGAGTGNPLMKTASDSQLSHRPSPSPHAYSPMSLDVESLGSVSGHHRQAARPHRHSLGGEDLSLTGHSPMLPPIKTGSASSQHSREREKISWRTEPAEKNVGWGGGKKRLVRK